MSKSGRDLLADVMRNHDYSRKVNNKLRGAYGETDLDKGQIVINKKAHKRKGKYNIPKQDDSLINTIAHEEIHAVRPKMTERQVRKKTRTMLKVMHTRHKQKLYSRYTT